MDVHKNKVVKAMKALLKYHEIGYKEICDRETIKKYGTRRGRMFLYFALEE